MATTFETRLLPHAPSSTSSPPPLFFHSVTPPSCVPKQVLLAVQAGLEYQFHSHGFADLTGRGSLRIQVPVPLPFPKVDVGVAVTLFGAVRGLFKKAASPPPYLVLEEVQLFLALQRTLILKPKLPGALDDLLSVELAIYYKFGVMAALVEKGHPCIPPHYPCIPPHYPCIPPHYPCIPPHYPCIPPHYPCIPPHYPCIPPHYPCIPPHYPCIPPHYPCIPPYDHSL